MLQRRLRYQTVHVLAAVALGMYVAVPLPGISHICRPRYGCQQIQPPKLTTAVAIQAAEGYLGQDPPVVRFRLQNPMGAHPPRDYTDLAQAGLLRIVSGKPGEGSGPVYGLPTDWQREILGGFFHFTEVQTDGDVAYFIDIPVGQFEYVPGSAVLAPPHVRTGGHPTVTFKNRFVGNANATRLLRIGPPVDWTVIDHGSAQSDLRQLGKVSKLTLMLRACHGVWYAGNSRFMVPCP